MKFNKRTIRGALKSRRTGENRFNLSPYQTVCIETEIRLKFSQSIKTKS